MPSKHHKPNWIPIAERLAVYLRDNFTCLYCGSSLISYKPFDITLDHLKCRERHGANRDFRNLVTACRKCNSKRGSKEWYDYATGGARDRIQRQRRKGMVYFLRLAKAILTGKIGNPELEQQRCFERFRKVKKVKS